MARKPLIGLKHYIHKEAGSVVDQAYAIMEHYLPDGHLEVTLFGHKSLSIPSYNLIILVIGSSCLNTLMHEIGHAKLHKGMYYVDLNTWREYLEEIEAWVWAETECHRLGIKFDYDYAEDACERYRKKYKFRKAVHPAWRYE